MRVCFPVQQDKGLESAVFGHFGSAPLFLVVDTDTSAVTVIVNRDQQHARGACNPLKALDQQTIDAVVVGGIGGGALSRLTEAGIKVFRAEPGSVQENLALQRTGALPRFELQSVCGGHGSGHGGGGCSHH